MRIYIRICLFLMILFTVSCANDNVALPHNYFSLTTYFKKQMKKLQEEKMKLNKVISRNNETQTKTFIDVDWEKELTPFLECDINKPAWIQSYQTDTLISSLGLIKINYTAREDHLPVRSIVLSFNATNELMDITIYKKRHNFYYQSDIVYTYNAKKGFIISGQQHVRLLDQTVYHIEGNFIP